MITYCPIKKGLSSLAQILGREESRVPTMEGALSAEDACDRHECGFWNPKEELCGVAATAQVLSRELQSPASNASERSLESPPSQESSRSNAVTGAVSQDSPRT